MSGGLDIRLEVDLPPYLRTLNALGKDQLPFAVASTLTEVASLAQARLRAQLPRRFNIRSKWTAKGIQTKKARKGDWPRTYALVGTRDEYMVQQELGGIRRARSGRYRAIPSRVVKRRASGAVRKDQRPRALIGKGRAYFGTESIQLTGGKSGRGRKGTAYWLREQVRMRPRWGMRQSVQQTAATTIQPVFRRKMTAALRSRSA
jgi:phage gpG-like protein